MILDCEPVPVSSVQREILLEAALEPIATGLLIFSKVEEVVEELEGSSSQGSKGLVESIGSVCEGAERDGVAEDEGSDTIPGRALIIPVIFWLAERDR